MASLKGNLQSVFWRENYFVGSTINSGGAAQIAASPFTSESLEKFCKSFDDLKAKGVGQGSYDINRKICKTYEELVNTLDIKGELQINLPIQGIEVGGGGRLHFLKSAKENDFSVSFVVNAKQKDRYIQCGNLNLLKLKDTAKQLLTGQTKLEDKKSPIQAFGELYGDYLITGQDLGGNITFQSTYSTKSKEETLKIGGGLNASIKASMANVNIAGKIDVSYEKKNKNHNYNRSNTYLIRPSYDDGGKQSELATKIINNLNKAMSYGAQDIQETNKIWKDLDVDMQKYLSNKTIDDPINAIIVPLLSIGCITDVIEENKSNKYKRNAQETQSVVRIFRLHLNKLVFTIKSLQDSLDKIDENYWLDDDRKYNKNETDYRIPIKDKKSWSFYLSTLYNVVNAINGDVVIEYAPKYQHYVLHGSDDNKNGMPKNFLKKRPNLNSIVKLPLEHLRHTFDNQIMRSYAKYQSPPPKKDDDVYYSGTRVIIDWFKNYHLPPCDITDEKKFCHVFCIFNFLNMTCGLLLFLFMWF